ncbi:hypothetical protein AXG93_2839s1080 [Marchantia polymorpha subsp. ruderalis]|uniref:Uncharacterized protein n=1 Tax=Marchantia polymorpha subsp. ruderalis TaxID=1480154 RepID=A0A176VEY8_MARPO|nr:hypothetical protein AXG93_2839s1080 [Marchantia polymorpha subsp. ruderalis]
MVSIDRARRARSNEPKNTGNGYGNLESRMYAMKNMFRQRQSIAFGLQRYHLRRYNRREEDDCTYDIESVKVIQVEKKTFMKLFKTSCSRKNGWRMTEYRNQEQLRQKKLECAGLRRSSAAEKDLHTKSELECKGLWVDISNAQKVTVELQDKLELSRKEFERELKRVKKLTATLAARDQSHSTKLALKAKELLDCKVARTSELERRN